MFISSKVVDKDYPFIPFQIFSEFQEIYSKHENKPTEIIGQTPYRLVSITIYMSL